MNRFTLGLALLLAVAGVQAASGQYVVYYPATAAAYAPVTTYYAAAPVTTYYAPAAQPVTTYYAPSYSYYAPAPVTTYYAPAPVVAAPTTYVTRYRPILGGTVTTAYYGYVPAPRTYVYWRY